MVALGKAGNGRLVFQFQDLCRSVVVGPDVLGGLGRESTWEKEHEKSGSGRNHLFGCGRHLAPVYYVGGSNPLAG